MMLAEEAADLILGKMPLEPSKVEFYRHQGPRDRSRWRPQAWSCALGKPLGRGRSWSRTYSLMIEASPREMGTTSTATTSGPDAYERPVARRGDETHLREFTASSAARLVGTGSAGAWGCVRGGIGPVSPKGSRPRQRPRSAGGTVG